MRNILIHSPYWATLGGGERYALTLASCLQDRAEVSVTIKTALELQRIASSLDLSLSRVRPMSDALTLRTKARFHAIFWTSDGSIPALPVSRRVIHFQAPFQLVGGTSWKNRLKLLGTAVVCNSQFTKQYIDREYGVDSHVIYPPVETEKLSPGKKENMVLTVGRFSTSSQHKRQDVLIDAFQSLWKSGLKNWRMVMIGGVEDTASRALVATLRKKARGYPIAIRTDLRRDAIRLLYRKASLYWHAAGYGADLDAQPERAEHFGISTVEAMAAGVVPCSFAAGGQKEIITDGLNGILWNDPADLIRESMLLISNKSRREKLAARAIVRAQDFSVNRFCTEFQKIFLS